jgi:hypothetical protein
MNAINMPGFTAEAAIYKTSGQYQIAGIMAQSIAGRVVPAKAGILRVGAEQRGRDGGEEAASCVCPCKILVCPDDPSEPCKIHKCD